MPAAQPEQTARSTGEPAPSAHEVRESYWRSLHFFNVYRAAVAVLLLAVVAIWGGSLQFGSKSLAVFVVAAVFYVLFSILCFALTRIRWRFNLQLAVQVSADIVFIMILMRASGGISSGLGLLLLATLAGAALISRGRLALFYAALASIAVLLAHTYDVLRYDANVAEYVHAGLLSGGYFATAWLAHTLAKYTEASERLAAQREIDLANLAEVNQLVIQDMQDGVLVVDAQGVIRQINARAVRMLGPPREGRDALLRDYAPALAESYEKWRRSGGLEGNSGPLFGNTINARFVPIGRTGQVGAVIFLEDLSRAQSQAHQLKLAALGRLTANIAHEVRNPLGAISHAAELLQEEPAVTDTTRRLISIIRDNSRRIDRMVSDVLNLNRGDRARRESLPLAEFLQNFVERFCEVEKIRPELFTLELDAGPRVLFDRNHLDQVMWNLCRNAARHCRGGPGSIRIRVGTMRSGSIVKLDVVDDGPGVPRELRGQLFEPFFTTAAGGTGLGLYIARELCEANGAILDYVESTAGAQFTLMCRAGG